jgi:hypothetical protein
MESGGSFCNSFDLSSHGREVKLQEGCLLLRCSHRGLSGMHRTVLKQGLHLLIIKCELFSNVQPLASSCKRCAGLSLTLQVCRVCKNVNLKRAYTRPHVRTVHAGIHPPVLGWHESAEAKQPQQEQTLAKPSPCSAASKTA